MTPLRTKDTIMNLSAAVARSIPVMPFIVGACLPGAVGRASMRVARAIAGLCFP